MRIHLWLAAWILVLTTRTNRAGVSCDGGIGDGRGEVRGCL